MSDFKKEFLARIKSHIDEYGYHITSVAGGGPDPRFTYTIGLSPRLGFELVFAGGIFFSLNEVKRVIDEAIKAARPELHLEDFVCEIAGGTAHFKFAEVDPSWSSRTALGVFDYYRNKAIRVLQIIPDQSHWTLDIPNMAEPWDPVREPVWKWLGADWSPSFPRNAVAITNLDALKGASITELVRWEDAEWEMFSCEAPDVTQEEMRIVSMAIMLAIDPSLESCIDLEIGDGLLRDDGDSPWRPWGTKK